MVAESSAEATPLDKARGALAHAAEMDVDLGGHNLLLGLLTIAQANCSLAQAEALERIASALEAMVND